MKTIRTNCFETNSSSTHSITLCGVNLSNNQKPTMTFVKDAEIEIHVGCSDPDSNVVGKLSFLLAYADTMADQVLFDRLIKVVEDFSGAIIKPYKTEYNREAKTWEKNAYLTVRSEAGDLEDTFSEFIHSEYAHADGADIQNTVEKHIIDSDEKLIIFLFSTHSAFDKQEYYDG